MAEPVIERFHYVPQVGVVPLCECCQRTFAAGEVVDLVDGARFRVCGSCAALATLPVQRLS